MRKPRIEYPGALFHVIARGNQHQKVFLDAGDHARYLKLLGEHLEGCGFALYAYCLMSNHLHLLIEQTGSYPLSKYMQRLQSAYTSFFNRKHHKVGHLFQGRYKAILVDRDAYLLELVRYIHLNPQRAKMEKAEQYPWTSHRQYMGKDRHPLAEVKTGVVLGMFSSVKPVARKKYSVYMVEKQRDSKWNALYDLRDGRILGDEEFEEEINERTGQKKAASIKMRLGLDGLWKAVLRREGLKEEPVGVRRSHLMAETAYLVELGGTHRRTQVAEYFGMKPTAVTMAVGRLRERWRRGEGSKEALERWFKGVNSEA